MNRIRVLFVLSLVALAASVGAPSQAVDPPTDWFLLQVVAGDGGASEVGLRFSADMDSASGPSVLGLGLARTGWGGGVGAFDLGGGPLEITTTSDAGGYRLVIQPEVGGGSGGIGGGLFGGPPLAGGESVSLLVFGTSMEFSNITFEPASETGTVSAAIYKGAGSRVILAADPADRGLAIAAATAAAGISNHSETVSTGIVGAATDCNACTGSWAGPGGAAGEFYRSSTPTTGFQVFGSSFVGGAGTWSWSWSGAKEQATKLRIGTPTAWAYAPIGDLWHLFEGP